MHKKHQTSTIMLARSTRHVTHCGSSCTDDKGNGPPGEVWSLGSPPTGSSAKGRQLLVWVVRRVGLRGRWLGMVLPGNSAQNTERCHDCLTRQRAVSKHRTTVRRPFPSAHTSGMCCRSSLWETHIHRPPTPRNPTHHASADQLDAVERSTIHKITILLLPSLC